MAVIPRQIHKNNVFLCIIAEMNLFSKENQAKIFNALVVTFAFSAMCHLLLVTVVAIIKQDVSYINPLDFLGISIMLPQYRESTAVAAGGWVALSLLFFVILYIRVHYHLYVAIIRENKFRDRITKTTKYIKEKIKLQAS